MKKLIPSILVIICVATSVRAQDKCEAIFYRQIESQLIYPQDAFVGYNMGTVVGASGTPPGEDKYYPAQQRVEKYNQGGLNGYRVVKDRDAFYLPGNPGTPGRPPNISSDDPRVLVTAQPSGNNFMNVTFQGPRNRVLSQILKISHTPAKDMQQFQEMFPIAFAAEELPAAIELKNKIEQAILVQTQQIKLAKAAEKKRIKEEKEAQILAAQRAVENQARIEKERVAQTEKARVANIEAARLAKERLDRQVQERQLLAEREKGLSGPDSVVTTSNYIATPSFNHNNIVRAFTAIKPTSIDQINKNLAFLQTTKFWQDLQVKDVIFDWDKSFLGGKKKVNGLTFNIAGKRTDVVLTLTLASFLLRFRNDVDTKSNLDTLLTALETRYPSTTPYKQWQQNLLQYPEEMFNAAGVFEPDAQQPGTIFLKKSTNQSNGYEGSNYGSGSPVWEGGAPGPGSPVWEGGAPGPGSPVWGG